MPLPDVVDIPMGNPPCMKGLWKRVGNKQVVSGLWAMSQKAHTGPHDAKSKFEVTGVEKLENEVDSPRGGAFIGWFDYQDSLGPRRIEDKGYLSFEKNRSGGKNINGQFTNEFGRFTVTGTMSGTGRVEMFRIQKDDPGEEDKKSAAVRLERPAAGCTTGGKALNSSTSVSSWSKTSSHTKGVKRPASFDLKSENIPPLKRTFTEVCATNTFPSADHCFVVCIVNTIYFDVVGVRTDHPLKWCHYSYNVSSPPTVTKL